MWSTASPSYRTIVQYISGLKQHISFISSQKIPQNPDRYCVCGKKPLDSLFCGFLSVGEARHTIQLSGVSTFSILYRHSIFFFFFFLYVKCQEVRLSSITGKLTDNRQQPLLCMGGGCHGEHLQNMSSSWKCPWLKVYKRNRRLWMNKHFLHWKSLT